jgi:peptidoglycan/LPS O-acetylase OafA/YrhL
VHEVDVVRLLTFAAVIVVHAIDYSQPPSDRGWAGALMLLQFGREVFFGLTGFVLVYTALARPGRGAWSFWRKRLPYVLVPYVAWTMIYEAFHLAVTPGYRWTPRQLGLDLLNGGGELHLYFLLVSMQLYLVFPLLLRFVQRTAASAWTVLGVVGVLDLAWYGAIQYGPTPSGWAGFFWRRAYELLPSYSLYVLAGCYAAVHLHTLDAFARRNARALLLVAAGASVAALLCYASQLGTRPPRIAADVLQPGTVFTCVAAVIGLWLAGSWWVHRGRPFARSFDTASDVSFGVYLAHPLVLQLLLLYVIVPGRTRLAPTVVTLLAALGTAVGAAVISLAARRTPLSLALSGRPRRQRKVLTNSSSATEAVHTSTTEGDLHALPYQTGLRHQGSDPLASGDRAEGLGVHRGSVRPSHQLG